MSLLDTEVKLEKRATKSSIIFNINMMYDQLQQKEKYIDAKMMQIYSDIQELSGLKQDIHLMQRDLEELRSKVDPPRTVWTDDEKFDLSKRTQAIDADNTRNIDWVGVDAELATGPIIASCGPDDWYRHREGYYPSNKSR